MFISFTDILRMTVCCSPCNITISHYLSSLTSRIVFWSLLHCFPGPFCQITLTTCYHYHTVVAGLFQSAYLYCVICMTSLMNVLDRIFDPSKNFRMASLWFYRVQLASTLPRQETTTAQSLQHHVKWLHANGCHTPIYRSAVGGVLIPVPRPWTRRWLEVRNRRPIPSQTYGYLPTTERHRSLTGTWLYCSVTGTQRCAQLAQSCYAAARCRTRNFLIASPTS